MDRILSCRSSLLTLPCYISSVFFLAKYLGQLRANEFQVGKNKKKVICDNEGGGQRGCPGHFWYLRHYRRWDLCGLLPVTLEALIARCDVKGRKVEMLLLHWMADVMRTLFNYFWHGHNVFFHTNCRRWMATTSINMTPCCFVA